MDVRSETDSFLAIRNRVMEIQVVLDKDKYHEEAGAFALLTHIVAYRIGDRIDFTDGDFEYSSRREYDQNLKKLRVYLRRGPLRVPHASSSKDLV